jgi:hypothetical protein
MRLTQMAQNHVAYVETQMWQAWQQGHSSLSDLQAAVEGIIIHYVQWHQDFLMHQENNIDAIKVCATWWEDLSGQWQRADKKERALLAKEYSVETVADHMSRLFIERCKYKANLFAEKMILAMQPLFIGFATEICTMLLKRGSYRPPNPKNTEPNLRKPTSQLAETSDTGHALSLFVATEQSQFAVFGEPHPQCGATRWRLS